MDHVAFDREPPTTLTTLVMAFGGWIDAGRAATGTVRHLIRSHFLHCAFWWRRGPATGSLQQVGLCRFYDRFRECFSDFQTPPSFELDTHCVMKFMPSTPSATLG